MILGINLKVYFSFSKGIFKWRVFFASYSWSKLMTKNLLPVLLLVHYLMYLNFLPLCLRKSESSSLLILSLISNKISSFSDIFSVFFSGYSSNNSVSSYFIFWFSTSSYSFSVIYIFFIWMFVLVFNLSRIYLAEFSLLTNVILFPFLPARPVRPDRWT